MDTVLFMLKAITQEAAALASLWGIGDDGPTAFHLSCAAL